MNNFDKDFFEGVLYDISNVHLKLEDWDCKLLTEEMSESGLSMPQMGERGYSPLFVVSSGM